jgi:hypothetical protein
MRAPQIHFPGFKFSSKLSFGAHLQTGRRKSARPIDSKRALHVVMRSSQAVGCKSLKKFERRIGALIDHQATLHGVRVYARANAGNHLHLIIKVANRRLCRSFLRSVAGLIARLVTGRERGAARRRGRYGETLAASAARSEALNAACDSDSFWDARPFSRVVAWGRDFAGLKNYLHLNRIEALGFSRNEGRGVLDVCRQFGLDPPIS